MNCENPSTSKMSKKRRRHNSQLAKEQNTEALAISRSEDFWFEDGNLVLQAEDVQFKVHKGVLSRYSPVFATILSMPHTDDEPAVEGCPVLHVYDDCTDIRNLLLLLYDKCYDSCAPLPFGVVVSMVRIGKKYEIPHLVRCGLKHMKKEFPVTLKDWDIREKAGGHARIDGIKTPAGLFAMIKLALECGIETVLPSAYYQCCLDMDATLFGHQGANLLFTPASQGIPKICFTAHKRLVENQNNSLNELSKELLEHRTCRPMLRKGRSPDYKYERCISELWPKHNTELKLLERCDPSSLEGKNLCQPCIKRILYTLEQGREAVWDHLPSFFGLPDWNDLKNCG
ncbi:hypothetical protein DFP72DRAFT_929615 [Ephemerocybe angulata]|uniref:BTB domain-containing protein n=1 Tax=Ephemerocybe angulata TaxID=980116 RepID=A0A8H6HEA7_9AGAR|nr:hypothetical protein DFP72DRAFT_929615 [Tulosesus angulatus]